LLAVLFATVKGVIRSVPRPDGAGEAFENLSLALALPCAEGHILPGEGDFL
jgi:hypothetical protein